jgi:hypothetical protein
MNPLLTGIVIGMLFGGFVVFIIMRIKETAYWNSQAPKDEQPWGNSGSPTKDVP